MSVSWSSPTDVEKLQPAINCQLFNIRLFFAYTIHMGLEVGGYNSEPDWPKMGPSMLIAWLKLAKRNMELVAEGTYERNTTAVKGAVLAIKKGNPEAVIMVGDEQRQKEKGRPLVSPASVGGANTRATPASRAASVMASSRGKFC